MELNVKIDGKPSSFLLACLTMLLMLGVVFWQVTVRTVYTGGQHVPWWLFSRALPELAWSCLAQQCWCTDAAARLFKLWRHPPQQGSPAITPLSWNPA